MVQLTEKAVGKVVEILNTQDPKPAGLRILAGAGKRVGLIPSRSSRDSQAACVLWKSAALIPGPRWRKRPDSAMPAARIIGLRAGGQRVNGAGRKGE